MLGDIQLNMPHTHLRAQESKSEEMQLEMDSGFKTMWYLKAKQMACAHYSNKKHTTEELL